ncbi:hypothetical protein BOTBODRAFT_106823 [Botryobasidium botryosum FD-172 SS1]|uniref:Uncharacterized protein n=1 Tax=Botryobasidium botryosum (strain FD-172 SS1) TaxID=930990 RepID=A0A067MPY2_BOTB1|nr:hypothetical protein BOTBODRAFT_106823 [Botryobasidium botryosum FD-172 SS1]
MVEKTKGFYARDYSLGLGWNNMRYIIEASLLHAELLNRTLVLPSFVYARSCEWEIKSCAAYATMVNRGDAIGWAEWRELPIEQQMGWRIPMEIMLDIPHLRKTHSVILVSEYLKLHDLDPEIEWSNGAWNRDRYSEGTPKRTVRVIPNDAYDPSTILRVDELKNLPAAGHRDGLVYTTLMNAMGTDQNVLEWEVARALLLAWDVDTDEKLESLLNEHGWVVLHTFKGALGMDYLKSVVEPIKQVAPVWRLRGMKDDFDSVNDDILVLEGETHLNRKPGGLRFTTVEGRDNFAALVLYGLQPIEPIRILTARMAAKMRERVGGRMWLAGHMRRGDFVKVGWAMEGSLQDHFNRIKSRLAAGRTKLHELIEEASPQTCDVPRAKPNEDFKGAEPPKPDDPFFLATDERSEEGIKWMKEQGAVFISDLLTPEDRRLVGWPLMITDVLALVEQDLMAHGAYFYAHAMSSVAGGAVNMRAALGMDPRSTLID